MTPPPSAVPPSAPVPDGSGTGSPHPDLARLVTASVWILRGQTRRQAFAPTARILPLDSTGAPVGDPSTNLLAATAGEPDHALRVDLAVAGLDRVLTDDPGAEAAADPHRPRRRAALLTVRPGPLESLDGDHAWSRAWLVACAIVGVHPDPVYVATRIGWFDLTTPSAPVVVPRLRGPQARDFGRGPR
ncbi:hypothetical protein SAMN05421678_107186 [Actinopolymorpha cephalotaxi]|uniref:Uncharacterized protein n=1 Tax=Actinopolymorpha cephalotaxi TaxID=504797 RepID=A0A1I2TGQ3_9ACTN|nr:hypothetical protein [Actinopolymorpha cephalotaxi]NYH83080.1 hypothetical protein [Actinopolymorpha cephalotaxi]SFG64043.1 hypothetical protein SAMN05421678_107186 [Actinopolymorpha cephalotaxi]